MRIKKGDQVKMLVGKDHGKSGAVLRVLSDEGRVVIEGLNLYKKRVRPKKAGAKGEMVSLPRAISMSNVMVVCPNCKRPTRVGHAMSEGRSMRLCKKCKASF
ncbi:MAG: 50S ribosomal protein L24 [Candidatus Liptonbacteria bacterium]|nr:50S ribosomal protein L24 [Candidatus Liptonbacteria bacterium]